MYTVFNYGNQILSISLNTSVATVLANTTNNAGYVDGTDRTQVRFNAIFSLSIDPIYKFLYICEYNNYFLRRLQLSNGPNLFNLTTLSNFTVNNPRHIAIDSLNEYLYVGTVGTGIFKFSLFQNNLIVLKAQTPSHEGAFFGVSIDPTEKFAYVADNYTNSLYSMNLTSGNLTLLAGSGTAGYKDGNGSNAMFNKPLDCLYNPYDSCVYIADSNNNAIRKITTPLYASTIAGLNASAIVQRTIASNSSVAYGQFALKSNFVTSAPVLPSIPGLQLWLDGSDPLATGEILSNGISVPVWWDKSGNGYNATPLQDNQPFSSNNSIFTYGGFETGLNSQMSNQTVFTVFYPESNYLSGFRDIIGTSAINSGIAIGIIDGFMNIKLSYNSNDRLGEVTELFIVTFSGEVNFAGLTVDLTGENIYYSHRAQPAASAGTIYSAVYRYNISTGDISVYYEAPNYSFSFEDIGFNSLGTLYTAGYPLFYIYRFSNAQPVGVINYRVHEPSTPFARDTSGNVYYAQSEVSDSTRTVKIYRLSSTNVETLYAQVDPAYITSSSDHRGLARDSLGNFYLSDFNLNVILKIATNLTTSVFAGTFGAGQGYIDGINVKARFWGPHGLAIDSMNNLYVSETFNRSLRKIDTSGNVTTVVVPLGLYIPSFLTIHSTTLYIVDSRSIKKINITPRPDFVIGGEVLPRCNVFTSVVQMGVTNGTIGYLNGNQVLQGSILSPFQQPGVTCTGISSNPTLFNHHFRKFRGTLNEIIIYNTAFNTTQRQAVELYLQQKWIQTSSYAGNSNTTTQRIGLKSNSIVINPNLYATTITAPTFTASMAKGGTASNGFFKGDSTKVTNISDRRLKYDIRPIENALEKVSSMQAVRYRLYRDPSQRWIGYVAQDLEVILPEVVRTDEQGWKSIQYSTLPALIIEAVKELNEKYEKIKYLLSTST
jgi:DNA-binding beta-propeller fold protein YncE